MNPALLVTMFALVSLAHASAPVPEVECFDNPPGEVGIPFDTPEQIKVSEVTINREGVKAFIATEYLGSPNLQATVYLLRGSQYCLAGDLGAAVAFKSSPQARSEGYYGLVVESKSGSDKFYRTFKYHSGIYSLAACKVSPANSRTRACKDSEK
jgi:hypothetical protein